MWFCPQDIRFLATKDSVDPGKMLELAQGHSRVALASGGLCVGFPGGPGNARSRDCFHWSDAIGFVRGLGKSLIAPTVAHEGARPNIRSTQNRSLETTIS